MRYLVACCVVLYYQCSLAFAVQKWTPGLHLLAGVGINNSSYKSHTDNIYLGWGTNLHTSAGWYINDSWAFDANADVKFNKIKSNLIWNTLLTLGLRYRINYSYIRPYGGVGLLVVSINEEQPFASTQSSRLHMEGPAVGLAFGQFLQSAQSTIWFWEISGSIQHVEHRDEVIMDGEVSISVASNFAEDDPTILSLHFTVGGLLF